MTERATYSLWEPQQAHKAFAHAWQMAKPALMAGHKLTLELRPEKRSDPQNRLLHATISEVAKQVEWAGKKHSPETWKRLLVAAWCRTQGEAVEVLPALDGHGVDIVPKRTSKLTKGECAELTEFVTAWAVEHGVELPAPDWMG